MFERNTSISCLPQNLPKQKCVSSELNGTNDVLESSTCDGEGVCSRTPSSLCFHLGAVFCASSLLASCSASVGSRSLLPGLSLAKSRVPACWAACLRCLLASVRRPRAIIDLTLSLYRWSWAARTSKKYPFCSWEPLQTLIHHCSGSCPRRCQYLSGLTFLF